MPNQKLVIGEVKAKTKNMVFPDQKIREGKDEEQTSFILPKCLKSFNSCVEDVDEAKASKLGIFFYIDNSRPTFDVYRIKLQLIITILL